MSLNFPSARSLFVELNLSPRLVSPSTPTTCFSDHFKMIIGWGLNTTATLDPSEDAELSIPSPKDLSLALGFSIDDIVWTSWSCTVGRGESLRTNSRFLEARSFTPEIYPSLSILLFRFTRPRQLDELLLHLGLPSLDSSPISLPPNEAQLPFVTLPQVFRWTRVPRSCSR